MVPTSDFFLSRYCHDCAESDVKLYSLNHFLSHWRHGHSLPPAGRPMEAIIDALIDIQKDLWLRYAGVQSINIKWYKTTVSAVVLIMRRISASVYITFQL